MNAELEAIKDAWDKNTGDGREEKQTRALADKYVKAHPDQFTSLQELELPEIVKAVELFREAGFEEEQWKAEVWLLHKFEPQNIGGTYSAQIRLR